MSADRSVHLLASTEGHYRLRSLKRTLGACCVLLFLIAFANGCAGTSARAPRWSRVHVVAAGETVWEIARRYGTTVDAIARVNRLQNASKIYVGDRLRVPEFRNARPPSGVASRGRWQPSSSRTRMRWPVRGQVSSRFGRRWGANHDGIDIAAPSGTPVRAAADGIVVHNGNQLAGYGNLIILKHRSGQATVYAHNRINRVKVGQKVRAGDVIGEVGRTGRTTGPHLHFEVREGGTARDPLDFLP